MHIKRTLANKIMTLALRKHETSLFCLLSQDEKLICAQDCDDLRELWRQSPQALLVYNQHPRSLEMQDCIEYRQGQCSIEVFQDTEGVFGLRAWCIQNKLQTPIELELSDD